MSLDRSNAPPPRRISARAASVVGRARTLAGVGLAVAAALACAAGCARTPPWPPQPVDLAFGEEACAECRMFVSDARFAVQLHRAGGPAPVYFDDLSCLVRYADKAAEASQPIDLAGVFVRAYPDGGWVGGGSAWVVHAKGIVSPMGSGYATFGARAAADAEAARQADATVAPLGTIVRSAPST